MTIFALEFVFFIVAMFAILVSVSATALFIITYRYERALRSMWRSLGFLLLAVAFFLFILERKFNETELIGMLAAVFLMVGFFNIYRGVRAEPVLSQLFSTKGGSQQAPKISITREFKEPRNRNLLVFVGLALLVLTALMVLLNILDVGQYTTPVLLLAALIFVVLTIQIQIKRYQSQKSDPKVRRQNLYPLMGYVFLVGYLVALILNKLPEFDIVFLRKMILDYSIVWHLALYFVLLAFIFLGIWAWNFIKLRGFLRIYVIFLALIVLVACLGTLIFNYFLFNIVERNNLDLMERGAETQELIMYDRSNIAMLIAELMAKDAGIAGKLSNDTYQELLDASDSYLEKTNVDVIRVYNNYGEIIASPTDTRDRGRVFWSDSLLAYAITEKSPIRSYDVMPGVLADVFLARAIYPVMSLDDSEAVIGAVEVGYKFDNAFVDYSKEQTGLEATVYSGDKRTATTIHTLDNVSRWVGSVETENGVKESVLENGEDIELVVDRLGIPYYSAYKPVKNINGKIIGMVSVGVPTNILIEDTRQQLLSIFLIVTITALFTSALGAVVLFAKQRQVAK